MDRADSGDPDDAATEPESSWTEPDVLAVDGDALQDPDAHAGERISAAEGDVRPGASPDAPGASTPVDGAGASAPDGPEDQDAAEEADPREPADDLPYLDLEAAAALAGDDEAAPDVESSTHVESAPEPEEDGFDFGGLEDELEVEETFEPPTAEDPSRTGGEPADLGGMELETSREFDTGDYEAEDEPALEFERPMSEFSGGEPPSWMEEEEVGEGAVLDFSAVGPEPEVAKETAPPESAVGKKPRVPRTRPSPPRFKRQRNLAGPIIGIVLLLAVGIGGYVAWPVLSHRLSGSADAEASPVTIPTLSPDLMPVMREAAIGALASIFEDAREAWATPDRVQEPPAEWLAGVYLAEAGAYEDVEAFWAGTGEFVDEVRGIELIEFDAALTAELEDRGIAGEDAEAIRERADSGFVAAQPRREEVFEGFDALIDAALDLHGFLVANQGRIEYAPASAVTTDPILEVNPATPEIRSALEERLDEVTRALSSLDYRERVTASGLRSLLLSRIQDHGIE